MLQTEIISQIWFPFTNLVYLTMPLPAHYTKHLNTLRYSIGHDLIVSLAQLDDGKTNGTTLWLGAQCLSLFLANSRKRTLAHPKAVELGSGIGFTACARI